MAPQLTRSILVTMTATQWGNLIDALAIHTERKDPQLEAAVRAFMAQIAYSAVGAPQKTGNGHARA